MITLLEVRTQVRSALDEALGPRAWENYELDNWINEGARDIARRSETIQSFFENIRVLANVGKYAMPDDMIRIHRVEFVIASQTYPVAASTYAEMDQYWGSWQTVPGSIPAAFVLWGTPGISLEMQLYPIPAQNGLLNIFYYRQPRKAERPGDPVEVPEGWHDAVVLYCEFQAKRRDKDPLWQEAKQLYEQALGNMILVTRQWHDQNQSFITANRAVPSWLYSFEDY